jgi:plasmid stabilization system protein ParE
VPEVGSPNFREVIVGDYRVMYRLTGDVADIATVLHGARHFTFHG